MPLTPTTPITTEGKTYDKFWMADLTIQAPLVGDLGTVSARLIPYNSETNEEAPIDMHVSVTERDCLQKIQEGDTVLGDAYNAILNAVQTIYERNQ